MARLLNHDFVIENSENENSPEIEQIFSQQKEIDHRIANSLQLAATMLRFEGQRITDVVSAHAALESASLRLLAVARTHRLLGRTAPDSLVDLAAFMRPFCEDVAQSIGAIVEVRAEAIRLRADVATQLCIIVNELAMNAVKYGHQTGAAPVLTLDALPDGQGWLCVTLRDDGPGLPDDFLLEREGGGLGMLVLTATVEKLKGSIRAVRGHGDGACFEIRLPIH